MSGTMLVLSLAVSHLLFTIISPKWDYSRASRIGTWPVLGETIGQLPYVCRKSRLDLSGGSECELPCRLTVFSQRN